MVIYDFNPVHLGRDLFATANAEVISNLSSLGRINLILTPIGAMIEIVNFSIELS